MSIMLRRIISLADNGLFYLSARSTLAEAEVPVAVETATPVSAADGKMKRTDLDNRPELSLGGIMFSAYLSSASGAVSAICPSSRYRRAA